ncbi:uncharacterized mitochondrial protein-like protein [Tanacetum coccineum]
MGNQMKDILLGYFTSSKAFRVYNKRTKRVKENIHIDFLEDQPNVPGSTQEHDVAGSSGKDKGHTQEYILLPIHPYRLRISAEDVVQAAQDKPSENTPKDIDVEDSEDIAEKEGQHKLTKAEQTLTDELERLVAQEVVAEAMDDATRHAFEKENRTFASKNRTAQVTSINKLNTGRPTISTANTPYISAASTPTGIFSGAYDDEDEGAEADFNNMDNTIEVNPIPIYRIHKDNPKGQILEDPKSAVQTRGKIQKVSLAQQALVFKNKRDERSIVVKNKARLVAQGFRQEEGNDYDEVFAPIARQDKYVADILKKFDFYSIRITTTPTESNKPLVKDEDGEDVDMNLYRSMIGSLMYLTASRPDIMFAVSACARFQVTPNASHLHAVKRIFKYLKDQPKLGLWYPRDSPFELEAFSDSDYGGASLDRKLTIGGC